MLLLQIILDILMGHPHEKQEKIRENIRLLSDTAEFNNLINRYGRFFLLKLRVRKYIGMYEANEFIHNSAKRKQFCLELEKIITKK